MSSILLVTPFAPQRDGIATYAAQELQQLRADGHKVDVVSPLPSAAHYHVPLGNPAGALKLVQLATGYDRTILQFGPEMLFGRAKSAAARAAVWAALAALGRACPLDLRIHELEYEILTKSPIERSAARRAIHGTDRVTVHTETEANQLATVVGIGRGKVEVIDHGAHFVPRTMMTRAEAKAAIGIDPNRFAFVSIGFLQYHKGFDLAAEAMLSANLGNAELHIVGSKRVSHPDINRYVDGLKRLCAASDRMFLHERFVSDDEFDQWVRAADAVVLPYREIWSSSVLERAQVLGTRVIASDLPQLKQQVRGDSLLISDLDDLRVAMEKLVAAADYPDHDLISGTGEGQTGNDHRSWNIAGEPKLPSDSRDSASSPLDLGRVQAQVELRARAGLLGPSSEQGRKNDTPQPLASESLMALGDYEKPEPVSHRLGVGRAKRTVLSLVNWQLAPIIQHVEDLQRATTEAIVRLEHRQNQMDERPIDVTDSDLGSVGGTDARLEHGVDGVYPTVGLDDQFKSDSGIDRLDPFLSRELVEGKNRRRSTDPRARRDHGELAGSDEPEHLPGKPSRQSGGR